MDEVLNILQGLGVSHFNAVLIAVILWLGWKKANQVIDQNEAQSKQLIQTDVNVQLIGQKIDLHSVEDDRRFEEIHAHIRSERL